MCIVCVYNQAQEPAGMYTQNISAKCLKYTQVSPSSPETNEVSGQECDLGVGGTAGPG